MDNIVITGTGIICAIGKGMDTVSENLQRGVTGIGRARFFDTGHNDFPVGEIKSSNIGLGDDGSLSRTEVIGICALKEALESAGVTGELKDSLKFISGTTVGNMDVIEGRYFDMPERKENRRFIRKQEACTATETQARLAGLKRRPTTVSTACSSALNAIILGARLLRAGMEDMVVAGGSEGFSQFHYNGFRSLRIMDSRPCRPFSGDRGGLSLGEGAAYVVLERESDARRRGAGILAYVTGTGNRCDAYHQTASSPDGEGAYLAMKDALEDAGLQPGDIGYINAHGTGTPDNDPSESAAIRRVFGACIPPVSSTKGYTGHTTSAAGAIEAVLCLAALRGGFIPVNLGWDTPAEDCIIPVTEPTDAKLTHVMCNSFGFGGNDSSLILSAVPAANRKTTAKVETEVLYGRRIDSDSQLTEIGRYLKPMQARRMGRILKASCITSLETMEMYGVEKPDAIISTTALGMFENSENFLRDIKENDGEGRPSIFMQSTYNTIASTIAIMTGCRGYNMTYAEREMEDALQDARLLIAEGKAETVLVGLHGETTPLYRSIMEMDGTSALQSVFSQSAIVRKVK